MAQPIHKLFICSWKEPWYQLSEEERTELLGKVGQALEAAGGKSTIVCDSAWADEQAQFFGIEEYPSIEAVQQVTQAHAALNWFRYIESKSLLGTAFASPADT